MDTTTAPPVSLPRDADGFIETSAEFGQHWMVQVEYNTDFDGRRIDETKEPYPSTFHGPFDTEAEAVDWMDAYPDGDLDIHDMHTAVLNKVRGPKVPR